MRVSKILKIHARVIEFCSGNKMQISGRGTAGQPDIGGDANTPHFVGQEIKMVIL